LRGLESIKLPPGLTPPEILGIDEQGKEDSPAQFHEPVVTDQGGKISAKLDADAPQVILLHFGIFCIAKTPSSIQTPASLAEGQWAI
jgi:hypothetical protein